MGRLAAAATNHRYPPERLVLRERDPKSSARLEISDRLPARNFANLHENFIKIINTEVSIQLFRPRPLLATGE